MTENLTPEPCTSWSRRKRHYSTDLRSRPVEPGRYGWALCGAEVQDEDLANHRLSGWTNRRVVIADLPVCKLCARKAGVS